MRAITLQPGVPNSARLDEVPEPPADEGSILVRTLALGVCGTDREIIAAEYGEAPPGQDRLILGHESFGEVQEAPADSGFKAGDHVVGIVRRPDPVPCPACAAGEWDMCCNGQYTERGIKARNGYGAERFRIEPDFAVKIDPALGGLGVLLEPATVVAKAWDHAERIGRRSRSWAPKTLFVAGAGPVGLLAALFGKLRGLDVHVFDRHQHDAKTRMAGELGATHHTSLDDIDQVKPDIVMECTGAAAVVRDVLGRSGVSGTLCLLSVTAPKVLDVDIGKLNRTLVLENQLVFGSVNANRAHYEMAAADLARADQGWLGRMITRRVPLDRWPEALESRPDDIKVVIDFAL